MSIKLVIFDLDNTLIITSTAAKDAYKRAIYYIAEKHGIKNQAHKLYHHWKKIVQNLKNESDPIKRQFDYSLSLLLRKHKLPETYLSQALSQFNHEYLNNIKIQKGVKETFQWLKKHEIVIAVSTESMKSIATKKLKKIGVYKDVDFLLTANDVGIMKPHSDYYKLILKSSGVPKKNTLAVGNDKTNDIAPAKSLGLRTFLIPPNNFHLGTIKEEVNKLSLDT